jgi:hypothetical protein
MSVDLSREQSCCPSTSVVKKEAKVPRKTFGTYLLNYTGAHPRNLKKGNHNAVSK